VLTLRRNFTRVIKSFTEGPSSNQMEDANTNDALERAWGVSVMYNNQIEEE
jgi:hypothetical protein